MSLSVPSSTGPFLMRDLNVDGAKYLEPSDIAHASQVCKQWKVVFSDQNLWKVMFENEGIPLVISANGKARDYKEDFKVLHPITISGKIISQYLGKVIEKIPPITEEQFDELKEPDPFEEGKSKGETFIFIVDPSIVIRTINKEKPLALNDQGDLTESPETENSELTIPLSLKNIDMLSLFPLEGKQNAPVFPHDSYSDVPRIFEQCKTRPDKISVYFMRRDVVNQSRGKHYDLQNKLVEAHGFEILPLRVRVLFDTVCILKDGTCPDVFMPRPTVSRHPDIVRRGNEAFHTYVGNFSPHCLNVYSKYFVETDSTGVVPGRPAKVPATGT